MPIAVKVAAQQRLARPGVTLLGLSAERNRVPGQGQGHRRVCERRRERVSGVAPVMDAFARAHYHVGPFGAGSKMKFVANLLVAIHNVAAAKDSCSR